MGNYNSKGEGFLKASPKRTALNDIKEYFNINSKAISTKKERSIVYGQFLDNIETRRFNRMLDIHIMNMNSLNMNRY